MRCVALAVPGCVAALFGAVGPALSNAIEDWYSRAQPLIEAFDRTLVSSDRDVIVPPGDVDPQMPVVPPPDTGPMPIIRPRSTPQPVIPPPVPLLPQIIPSPQRPSGPHPD